MITYVSTNPTFISFRRSMNTIGSSAESLHVHSNQLAQDLLIKITTDSRRPNVPSSRMKKCHWFQAIYYCLGEVTGREMGGNRNLSHLASGKVTSSIWTPKLRTNLQFCIFPHPQSLRSKEVHLSQRPDHLTSIVLIFLTTSPTCSNQMLLELERVYFWTSS